MFFNLFLYLFTRSTIQTTAKTQNIFILVRNSNMDGDMYNGFLFNRLYPRGGGLPYETDGDARRLA